MAAKNDSRAAASNIGTKTEDLRATAAHLMERVRNRAERAIAIAIAGQRYAARGGPDDEDMTGRLLFEQVEDALSGNQLDKELANSIAALLASHTESATSATSATAASTTSASTTSAPEASEIVLELDGFEYVHLITLLDIAERSMPGDTDADDTRACLRAARDFLMRMERPVREEATHG